MGFAYLTRKAANCDLILPNALSAAESASACSLTSVFAAVAAPEKDSFSSGDWRTSSFACALFTGDWTISVLKSQPASRAYQSTLRVTYITIANTTKSAMAPMSSA